MKNLYNTISKSITTMLYYIRKFKSETFKVKYSSKLILLTKITKIFYHHKICLFYYNLMAAKTSNLSLNFKLINGFQSRDVTTYTYFGAFYFLRFHLFITGGNKGATDKSLYPFTFSCQTIMF